MDANRLLFESSLGLNTKFDVIDLDPYGSVGPFLDAAIHACNNDQGRETLLCITCTDSRVLCGPDTQKCFSVMIKKELLAIWNCKSKNDLFR